MTSFQANTAPSSSCQNDMSLGFSVSMIQYITALGNALICQIANKVNVFVCE